MYAGTKVNWHEVLMPDSTTAANDESLPLFLCAFSADKGTEDITDLVYKDFKAMYGNNADFFKYGQPLIQAHSILAAGGRVLGKRIVADDAILANLIITAEIITSGEGTSKTVKVKYATHTVETAKTLEAVETAAAALESKENKIFPIMVVCDNGRGTTVKSFRVYPDYDVSKTLQFMLYSMQDIEGTNTIESARFAMYPDAITYVSSTKKNVSLSKHSTTQFLTSYCKPGFTDFVEALATETNYSVDDLYTFDILFAKTVKGDALSAWSIDDTGVDLTATYGLKLQSGSNGTFGEAPFAGTTPTDAWTAAAKAFFDGTFSDEIYDLDQHKIDFCVDANYPDAVKHAIAELADFRQDFFYFRDLGLGMTSLSAIQEKVNDVNWEKSAFVGDYYTSYDIIDDYSKKQINVTMLHGLAPLLVNHYATNVAAPIAGEFNNFVITEPIEGTLSFIPRITPKVDQKTILDDLKVNYINHSSNGAYSIQSTYTSQDHWGPLSYSSNVIITQMCIKDIRRYTPKIRFMLMDSGDTDFTKYKQLIENNVITNYTKYFKSVALIYTRDDEMIAAKIFNASLYCYYKDFPQGEIFDVFAVEGSYDTNPAY